jgi:hypothetical protein
MLKLKGALLPAWMPRPLRCSRPRLMEMCLRSGGLQIMENNLEDSRILTELRNTLLPRLMSGEIRVKDAL